MVLWRSFGSNAFTSTDYRGDGSKVTVRPYKGLARVRLEKSPFLEHANTHIVVLRVLEILEPVECDDPQYRENFSEPVAGELLMRNRSGGKNIPWVYNLDRKGKNIESLFEEDDTIYS
ncbi:hypothetical protein GALMADRAFT_241904 [Galerina marginata CBS 339.88]|uniref:Uncharacterized protein n=1 Tax=Galerina marginata (strain CBS 339.88) TaxID=685588 RepID=A0A067T9C4_GALM3|nr:hypothetical protein GALMADRAFT_241904 [Galerina marginata CBS 339.88]